MFALMAAGLGLVLAKRMIETRSIVFAWALHCVLDFIVFFTMAAAANNPAPK